MIGVVRLWGYDLRVLLQCLFNRACEHVFKTNWTNCKLNVCFQSFLCFHNIGNLITAQLHCSTNRWQHSLKKNLTTMSPHFESVPPRLQTSGRRASKLRSTGPRTPGENIFFQTFCMYIKDEMERRRKEFNWLFACNHAKFASKSRPICFRTWYAGYLNFIIHTNK